MEKVTEKKNDFIILLMAILFTVFQTLSVVLAIRGEYYSLSWIAESALIAIMCFMMYASYHTHTKNVMKPVIGATLVMFLYWAVDNGFYYLQYIKEYIEYYVNDIAFIVYMIACIAICFALAAVNIVHYIINSTHHSSPKMIKLNKVFYWIYFGLVLIKAISCILMEPSLTWILSDFFGCMADCFAMAIVIIIESKLDGYRILREAKAENSAE